MVRKLSLSRLASVPRIGAAAVAIAAAAVFCSLELSENPSGQFSNPPQLLAKHHTLSFTLHAGVTKDGKNSFYFDGQPITPLHRADSARPSAGLVLVSHASSWREPPTSA